MPNISANKFSVASELYEENYIPHVFLLLGARINGWKTVIYVIINDSLSKKCFSGSGEHISLTLMEGIIEIQAWKSHN